MLDILSSELKLRGFSQETVKSYIFHNKKFNEFIQKDVKDISEDDIKAYLGHLISDKKLSAASVALAGQPFLSTRMRYLERVSMLRHQRFRRR